MKIIFYRNGADTKRVDKTSDLIQLRVEEDCYFKQPSSITTPYITIQSTEQIHDLGNYCYIEELNRYYFIVDIISLNNNLWGLTLKEDVLMTYKDYLSQMSAYISRQENIYNKYLVDTEIPVSEKTNIDVSIFSKNGKNIGFNTNSYCWFITFISESNDDLINVEYNDVLAPIPCSNLSPVNKTTKTYCITDKSVLKQILNDIVNDSTEFASWFVNIYVAPIDDNFFFEANYISSGTINIHGKSYTVTNGGAYLLTSRSYVSKTFSLELTQQKLITNSFFDFEPYSLYEIYIPYYGWYKINPIHLQNITGTPTITVRYFFDFTNGTANINIISNGNLWDNLSIDFFQSIPLNSSNAGDIERQSNVAGIRLIATTLQSAIGAVGAVAGGVMAGGAIGSIGGLSAPNTILNESASIRASNTVKQSALQASQNIGGGIVGGLADALSFSILAIEQGRVNNSKSIWGSYANCGVFILRVSKKVIMSDTQIARFANYRGRPLYDVRALGVMQGFTIIQDIHLDTIPCVEAEREELYNILRSGVIF